MNETIEDENDDKDLLALLPKDFTMDDYCSRTYWRWEKKAEEYLKGQGYTVGRWRTTDGDSFGPLVRSVTLTKDGKTETYYYG